MSKQLSYLKSVLLSQLLLEANEELIGTKQHRQNIKTQIKKLNRLLGEDVRKEYDRVYNTDPEMTTNILNKIESLVEKIMTSDIDELVMIDSVVDKYQENKEWFTEYASAEFLRIN